MDSRYDECPTCGDHKKRTARQCQDCAVISRYGTQESRFWNRVITGAGCWTWTGHISTNGYGRIRWDGKQRQAHRVSYALAAGPIPDGLVLDHLCRNQLCVNPDHLEAVTDRVNILRGTGTSAANARKDRCPNGHSYDGEQAIRGKPTRLCLTCKRNRERAYKPAWRTRRAADKCREALAETPD